jgi:hypothetical protein
MSRFYFSVITNAEKIIDEEGTELPDLNAARAEAIEDARALMSDAILGGRDISDRSIEISNESGEVLMVVPFVDAVSRLD